MGPGLDLELVRRVLAKPDAEWAPAHRRVLAELLAKRQVSLAGTARYAAMRGGRRVDAHNADDWAGEEVQDLFTFVLEGKLHWDPAKANGDLIEAFVKYVKGSARGGFLARVAGHAAAAVRGEDRVERDTELHTQTEEAGGGEERPLRGARSLGGAVLAPDAAGRLVWGEVRRFPAADRQLVVLIYLRDFQNYEAALAMQLSFGNGRKRLAEVRRKIRSRFARRFALLHLVGLLDRRTIVAELRLDHDARAFLLLDNPRVFAKLVEEGRSEIEEALAAAAKKRTPPVPAYLSHLAAAPWASLAIWKGATPEELARSAPELDPIVLATLGGEVRLDQIKSALRRCFEQVKPALDLELAPGSEDDVQELLRAQWPTPEQLALVHLVFGSEPGLSSALRAFERAEAPGGLVKLTDTARELMARYSYTAQERRRALDWLRRAPRWALNAAFLAGRSLGWVEAATGQDAASLRAAIDRAAIAGAIEVVRDGTEDDGVKTALEGIRSWVTGPDWPRATSTGAHQGALSDAVQEIPRPKSLPAEAIEETLIRLMHALREGGKR